MDLGEKIRAARKTAKLSQESLGKETLTSGNIISKIELGETGYAKEKLEFICDYLSVFVDGKIISDWHKNGRNTSRDGQKLKIAPVVKPKIKERQEPKVTVKPNKETAVKSVEVAAPAIEMVEVITTEVKVEPAPETNEQPKEIEAAPEPQIVADNIDKPDHYQGRNGLEAIEVIKNFSTDEMEVGFYWGNAVKYLTRYRNKNGLEDLKKARKNLDWLIAHEEGN